MKRLINIHSLQGTGLEEPHFVLLGILLSMLLCIKTRLLLSDLYCLRSDLLPMSRHTMSSVAKFFNYFIHFSKFSNELALVIS